MKAISTDQIRSLIWNAPSPYSSKKCETWTSGWPAFLLAQRPEYRLGGQRQIHQADANRVVERVGDGGRQAERCGFADALGAERRVVLIGVDGFVHHDGRQVGD